MQEDLGCFETGLSLYLQTAHPLGLRRKFLSLQVFLVFEKKLACLEVDGLVCI